MSHDALWPLGSVVPSHYNGGIVAASFFASLSGCILTIELLHRRATALGNLRSWLETLGCATSMGLVGIWSMHFIGNRAIILGDGSPYIQLINSPRFTTLSVFLPILGLTIAFAASEISTRSILFRWSLSLCTGIFAGLSIVGMHYIGNLGISNYTLHYAPRFLAASIIISIGDCILVLMLFYAWREKWITAWWKRLACGLTLAGGITAMHFAASTNCTYVLTNYSNQQNIRSRNIQVLAAGVLCGAASVLVLTVLLIIQHRYKVLRGRSQKVMLACAMFDPNGRILVTTEGVLPAREITDKYHHRSFDEDLDISHPVFHWMLRVSHNWSTVCDIIPKMKNHINAHADNLESGRLSSHTLPKEPVYHQQTSSDYSVILRERFCVAAASLATSMHVDLRGIGVLYDKIIETGTVVADQCPSAAAEDLERNPMAPGQFGKGQLLFITARLDEEDVDRLLNAGFRFASIQHVGRNVAEAMQIPTSTLEIHMSKIEKYLDRSHSESDLGTRLACLAMVPKPGRKGFDVAVQTDYHGRLPDVTLWPDHPVQSQVDFLSRMDGMRSKACLNFLQNYEQVDPSRSRAENQLASSIAKAIMSLGHELPSEWFAEASFFCQPLRVPQAKAGTYSTMFAFCVIADMHTTLENYPRISRVPLGFFNTLQRCMDSSGDRSILACDIRYEFSTIPSHRQSKDTLSVANYSRWSNIFSFGKLSFFAPKIETTAVNSEANDVHEMVQTTTEPQTSVGRTPQPKSRFSHRGILVDSETVVATESRTRSTYAKSEDALHREIDVVVGKIKSDDTFVDQLVNVARARFLLPKGANWKRTMDV